MQGMENCEFLYLYQYSSTNTEMDSEKIQTMLSPTDSCSISGHSLFGCYLASVTLNWKAQQYSNSGTKAQILVLTQV